MMNTLKGLSRPSKITEGGVTQTALPGRSQTLLRRVRLFVFASLAWLASEPLCSGIAHGQGILTVTPGPSVATSAGTGKVGYSGDGAQAISAQLARPSGIAYDAAGNLFLADTNNHVVREITPAGVITTIAGTGIAGFGGDNGPAIAAFLDTPTGVAVDTSGALYVADSHNHRIRKVSQGIITTIAGTGSYGFSGDGGSATSAQLALPSAVALDNSGNLYVTDTNNQRIRRVSAGTITTVGGNGEELFAGDGGSATAASLDQPTGITVDTNGTLYIADKNNQRIRSVSPAGVISTIAGNGSGAFSGTFSGDGGLAAGASLAKPVNVSVDAAGNVYVADTNNQRIRKISSGGVITTVAGTGDQGFAGDNGPATAAILNNPRAMTTDITGNLIIADTRNQRLRSAVPGQLTFAAQSAGSPSAPQPVTLTNTGDVALTVTSLTVSGPFATAAGATCSAPPIVLTPGASCTENVAFVAATPGKANGTLTIGGQGIATQTVLLAGTSSQASTSLTLTANKATLLSGESVTLSATLNVPGGSASGATGSISFYAGTSLLGTGTLTSGVANLSTSALHDGTQLLTALYNGTGGFSSSTAPAITANVADYNIGAAAAQSFTVIPGHTVPVPLSLPVTGANGITGDVAFSVASPVAGLNITFSPATVPLNNGTLAFTMNVTAAPAGPAAAGISLVGTAILLFLFVLPSDRRRKLLLTARTRPLMLLLLCGGTLMGAGTLAGCGSNTGFFGQKQQTYSVTVAATATDSTGGTLTRTTPVTITVQ